MTLTKLDTLFFSYTPINSITFLLPLMTNLQYLDLAYNQISSVAILEHFTNLRWLDLRGNPLTSAQVNALRHRLPNCWILF
jgi:Leucine-rich repeat (LRR) protein